MTDKEIFLGWLRKMNKQHGRDWVYWNEAETAIHVYGNGDGVTAAFNEADEIEDIFH